MPNLRPVDPVGYLDFFKVVGVSQVSPDRLWRYPGGDDDIEGPVPYSPRKYRAARHLRDRDQLPGRGGD